MTVAQLIEELSKYPAQKAVRFVMPEVHMMDESGEWTQPLSELEAVEAKQVRFEGAFVLVTA